MVVPSSVPCSLLVFVLRTWPLKIRISSILASPLMERSIYSSNKKSFSLYRSILFPRYCSYPAEKVLSLPGYNNYEIEIGYTENNRLPPEADRHICISFFRLSLNFLGKILIQADDHMKEENAAITLSISLDQEGCIRYNTTQITIPQPVFTPSFLIIK